jgi:drug/metabolite transporter (DMT)-like permease
VPRTKLGRWAGGLAGAFVVLVLAQMPAVVNFVGVRPGTALRMVLGVGAALAGTVGLVAGAISYRKLKDRSAVVVAAIILGFLAAVILIVVIVEALA